MGSITTLPKYAKGGVVHMWGGGDIMGAVADAAGSVIGGAKDLGGGLAGIGGKVAGAINGNGGLFGQQGAAPEMANIQQGTSVADVQNAQQGVGNSLQAQQALLQALQAQGGLGMQNAAANNLQGIAGQYQNIANGTGPNPAQAMLNQATGANVANQAALMAGQRGAGANVGLLARQAAQQGAATQQQAVGQGATMQANQQLNAIQGALGAQQAYANQANQIAGQQIGQTGANTQAQLSNQGQLQNALQGVNNANVGIQSNINTGNVGLSQSNAAAKQGVLGGIMQGAGAILGAARGGMVHMADGGDPAEAVAAPANPSGPQSSFGKFLTAASGGNNVASSNQFLNQNQEYGSSSGPQALKAGTASLLGALKPKKKVDTGETVATGDIGPNTDQSAPTADTSVGPNMGMPTQVVGAKGGLAKGGGHVAAKKPSQKAEKSGNSYSNDKIPAMLSEGEIVLPRSVTQSSDPTAAAAKFVSQVLAKRKVK